MYQNVIAVLKKQNNQENVKAAKTKKLYGIHYQCVLRSPYELIEENDELFIVEKGSERQLVLIDSEPDLFIHFCQLDQLNEAYLCFISKYGLLGLSKYPQRYFARTTFEDAHTVDSTLANTSLAPSLDLWEVASRQAHPEKESINNIKAFHTDFKDIFSHATTGKCYVNADTGESIEFGIASDFVPYIQEKFIGWFVNLGIIYYPIFIDGSIKPYTFRLMPTTLAGALVLQLFRFIKLGKQLKICDLPTCDLLTARKRFCSDAHGDLYRQRKLRGKL